MGPTLNSLQLEARCKVLFDAAEALLATQYDQEELTNQATLVAHQLIHQVEKERETFRRRHKLDRGRH